jgi:hypothetical protein
MNDSRPTQIFTYCLQAVARISRLVVVLGLLATTIACAGLPKRNGPTDVTWFAPTTATTISVFKPWAMPHIALLHRSLPYYTTCWQALERKVESGYVVWSGQRGLNIVEGDFSRKQTIDCVERTLVRNRFLRNDVFQDGELDVFDFGVLGTVYVAWRGRFVLLGSREQVVTAMKSLGPNRDWQMRLRNLSKVTMMANVSVDATMSNVLDVPTQSYELVLDGSFRGRARIPSNDAWPDLSGATVEITSAAAIGIDKPAATSGFMTMHYASPRDAQRAAQHFAAKNFNLPFELEPTLATTLAALPQQIDGSTLTIRFDMKSFAGLDMTVLQQWAARLQATVQTSADEK